MSAITRVSISLRCIAGCLLILVATVARADFTDLHLFATPNDGTLSYAAPVLDNTGTKLIGVTNSGVQGPTAQDYNRGIIYSTNLDGSGYQILYKFKDTVNADGAYPLYGHLTRDGNTIYGTTSVGGNGVGTVWKINADGSGYGVVKAFNGLGSDGGFTPYSTTLAVNGGVIYGTTGNSSSGPFFPDQAGTVWKVNTDGSSFQSLHAFPNSTSTGGQTPYGGVTLSGSTLFGVTSAGGSNNTGTLYKVSTDGSGFQVLHDFGAFNSADGVQPLGSLTLSGTTLYGMTSGGGSSNGGANGTIFKINTDGTGYGVLRTFTGLGTDAANPDYGADLTLVGSTLYGATKHGGNSGQGTIFQINTDGTGYSQLFNFNGGQGSNPSSSPIVVNGKFYGTTPGNANGTAGTLYSFDPTTNTHSNSFDPAQSYAGFNTSFTPGLGTVLKVLGGTASGANTVSATYVSTITGQSSLASDALDFTGTGTDAFVLQLSFDQTRAQSLYGSPNNAFLGWLDPADSTWKNAVLGNTGGTPTLVSGAYDPAIDFHLGYYGVDQTNNTVWAVVNHNSDFAVFGLQPAPEPSRMLLLMLGGAGLLLRRNRRVA